MSSQIFHQSFEPDASFMQQSYYYQSCEGYRQGHEHEQPNILHRPISVPPRFYHENCLNTKRYECVPELAPLPLTCAPPEPSLMSSRGLGYEKGLCNDPQIDCMAQLLQEYHPYPIRPHSAPPHFHSIFVHEEPHHADYNPNYPISRGLSDSPIGITNGEINSIKYTNFDDIVDDVVKSYSPSISPPIDLSKNLTTGELNHSQSQAKAQCLFDIINNHLVSSCARNEHDSHFLQQQISIASSQHKSMALEQIKDEVVELSSHMFGNYVIQKFLEYGSPEQIEQISQLLSEHALELAINKYGCRVIQKALEFSDTGSKLKIFENIKNNIEECIDNENGNHVIQKCVVEIPAHSLTPIYELFRGRVAHFCKTMYGCRVVQRLLENCIISYQEEMINCIMEEIVVLSKDTWGNYVIQYLIENKKSCVINRIVPIFLNNFEELSYHKFSSNVVESCLKNCTIESISKFIEILLNRSNDKLVEFMTHEYGNYVIQTLLNKSTYKSGISKVYKRLKRYSLIKRIKSQITGRRVIDKLLPIKAKSLNKY